MEDLTSLAARIQRLEDRAALRELVARYSFAIDNRDMSALAALFTEDFCLRSQDGAMNLQGRETVIQTLSARMQQQGPSNHFGHEHLIDFDSTPDRASGLFSAHVEMVSQGQVLVAALRYQDEYRREPDGWRFAGRLASYLYFLPVQQYATAFAQTERLLVRTPHRVADYPEALPSWRRFYGLA